MYEIVNKFLLMGEQFMPEMHLQKCLWSIHKKLSKNFNLQKRIGKFMQTGNTDFIYRNELDKACFQHDMATGKSKD